MAVLPQKSSQHPIVSYIVTVYNKADVLSLTLASLRQQDCWGQQSAEFIFVDDASSDDSCKVIERETASWPQVHLVRNQENKGPAVRLNQGMRLARGKYIHFLDADDLLPKNATRVLMGHLHQEKADVIYGRFVRTQDAPENVMERCIPEDLPCEIFADPLSGVLLRPFVGMALMVKRSTLIKSGGCLEALFVQDQSLPLRLAMVAEKFLYLDAPVVWCLPAGHQLSSRLDLQHHDGFFAFDWALKHIQNKTMTQKKKNGCCRQLFSKMVSVVWKSKRQKGGVQKYLFFPFYAAIKVLRPHPFGLNWLRGYAKSLAS